MHASKVRMHSGSNTWPWICVRVCWGHKSGARTTMHASKVGGVSVCVYVCVCVCVF